MKKAIVMMAAAMIAGAASAADVNLSVDFASAYVFRGVTFNDGLVMQPGAEISGFPIDEKYGAVSIGIWGNYDIDDYGGTLAGNEFSEIDYFISYALPIKALDVSIGYCDYHYPNGGEADQEVSLSLGKALGDSGFGLAFTANYGVGGAIDESWYLQGGLDYGTDLSEKLSLSAGATVGYAVIKDGESGFNDATATVGLSYALSENWALNGSVSYIAQLDDEVLTDAAYDVDLLGMVGLSCNF